MTLDEAIKSKISPHFGSEGIVFFIGNGTRRQEEVDYLFELRKKDPSILILSCNSAPLEYSNWPALPDCWMALEREEYWKEHSDFLDRSGIRMYPDIIKVVPEWLPRYGIELPPNTLTYGLHQYNCHEPYRTPANHIIRFGCTGSCAVGWAMQYLGARKIAFTGCDAVRPREVWETLSIKTGRYQEPKKNNARQIRAWRRLAKFRDRLFPDCEILNFSSEKNVKSFPLVEIEEVMEVFGKKMPAPAQTDERYGITH